MHPYYDNDLYVTKISFQSLYHVDKLGDGRTFPVLEQVFTGTHRILKKEGVLLILADQSTTVRESIWFLPANAGIRYTQPYLIFFAKTLTELP